MHCISCDRLLSEIEQQVNEYGELETMCGLCIRKSSIALDMDDYTRLLWNAIGVQKKHKMPLWVAYIRKVGGFLIGFENPPYWLESKEEWVNDEGRTLVIKEYAVDDTSTFQEMIEPNKIL